MAVSVRLESITIDGLIRKALIDHKEWLKAPLNVVQKFRSDTLGPIEIEGRGIRKSEDIPEQEDYLSAMRLLQSQPDIKEARFLSSAEAFWVVRR